MYDKVTRINKTNHIDYLTKEKENRNPIYRKRKIKEHLELGLYLPDGYIDRNHESLKKRNHNVRFCIEGNAQRHIGTPFVV